MKKNALLSTIIVIALLFSGAVIVQAQSTVQTRTDSQTEVEVQDDRCDDGVCPEGVEETESTDISKRSARTGRNEVSISNGDLDGDGYSDLLQAIDEKCGGDTTCWEREIQAHCGADGVCVEALQQASYNNSRSNRSTVVGSEDVTGEDPVTVKPIDKASPKLMRTLSNDDIDEEDDTEQAQDYNSSRSNKPSSRESDDIEDDADRANYNNSRSNKSNVVGPDENVCDGVTCPDGSCSDTLSSCVPATELVAEDGKVYGWGHARRGDDGQIYSWGQGISVAAAARNDDGSEEATSTRVLRALNVDGHEIRDWSPEEKESFRQFRREAAATGTPEFAAGRITELALDNEDIEEISVEDEGTRVRYRTTMRLLGFIPMQREVEARAEADGEVEIDYPWYSFLGSKPDSDTIRGILSSIGEYGGGGGAGKVSL